MVCRSSWFLPDCEDTGAAPAPVPVDPVQTDFGQADFSPALPRPLTRYRGLFDPQAVAELAASRDNGAGLAALNTDPRAETGAARSTLLFPLLVAVALALF